MHEFLIELIAYVTPFTELLGASVVLWGCVQGLLMLLQRAWQSLNRRPLHWALRDIRIAIGGKMALGLDFFLAGDIVQTIVVPSKDTLMVLGGIVVIRTVMAYFLAKEIGKNAEE
jgi:uncharacterized membrane protein